MQYIDQTLTLLLNGSQSLFLDGLAWTATQTSTWIPLMFVLLYVVIQGNDLRGLFYIVIGGALCILLADQVASTLCKPWVARWRPTHDPFIMYAIDIVNGYRGGNYGFFSSHAANTMSIATFFALVFRNKQLNYWLFSWVLLNCWTRVYLGVHYVGDLTVGLIWGAIVGFSIYTIMKRKHMIVTINHATNTPAQTPSYSQQNFHLLIGAFLLTYAFILFKSLFFT